MNALCTCSLTTFFPLFTTFYHSYPCILRGVKPFLHFLRISPLKKPRSDARSMTPRIRLEPRARHPERLTTHSSNPQSQPIETTYLYIRWRQTPPKRPHAGQKQRLGHKLHFTASISLSLYFEGHIPWSGYDNVQAPSSEAYNFCFFLEFFSILKFSDRCSILFLRINL